MIGILQRHLYFAVDMARQGLWRDPFEATFFVMPVLAIITSCYLA